jgi:hypothetical protein
MLPMLDRGRTWNISPILKTFGTNLNRITRFALSVLLWAHALFAINIYSQLIWRIAKAVDLTAIEFLLLVLLVVFSYLASTGFWAAIGNLLYIYFFPFVLIFYIAKWTIKLLPAINRWLNPQSNTALQAHDRNWNLVVTTLRLPGSIPTRRIATIDEKSRVWPLLFRPLVRFTVLWCFLVLVATHKPILWVVLSIVLIHIARLVFRLIRFALISTRGLRSLEENIQRNVDEWLAKLAFVTTESPPTQDLRNLWQMLRNFELGVRALKNEALVSRWAALLCGVFLGCVHIYVSFLCSFAYYGIERLGGYGDSWPQLLVISVFIPFLATHLPKAIPLELLAGLQCTFVLSIGVSTVARYLRSQLRTLKTVATVVDARFSDGSIEGKYEILKQKFERPVSQLNEFDVDTYNALIAHQSALEQVKLKYAGGGCDPDAKAAINVAAEAYNTALSSWLRWRNITHGMVVGDAAPAKAKVVSDLAVLNTAMASMTVAVPGWGRP